MFVITSLPTILFLVILPWYLGRIAMLRGGVSGRWFRLARSAGAWSFALQSIALITVCSVLRITVGMGLTSLIAGWSIWIAVLAMLAGRGAWRRRRPWRLISVRWPELVPLLAVVVFGVVFFNAQIERQCFNGDGIEAFYLADSLRYYAVPHWEIETSGQYGIVVVNPAVVNSYWTMAAQVLLRSEEGATRIGWVIWSAAVAIVLLDMVRSGIRSRRVGGGSAGRTILLRTLTGTTFAALWFLSALWYLFYCGYYPWMTDAGNPGTPDSLFVLFLVLGLCGLRSGRPAVWAAMLVLASMVLYAGPVMLVLSLVAAMIWPPVPRGRILRAAAGAVAVVGVIAIGYLIVGASQGLIGSWLETIEGEYVADLVPTPAVWRTAILFFVYFVLACGFAGAGGLARPFMAGGSLRPPMNGVDRDSALQRRLAREWAWRRVVALTVAGYLSIVLLADYKNLHYLGPLPPLAVLLWLLPALPRSGSRTDATCASATRRRSPGELTRPIAACCGLLVAIVICWPVSRTPFTLNRTFGERTMFVTDSQEASCRAATVIDSFRAAEDLPSWGPHEKAWIGKHTWIYYADHSRMSIDGRLVLVSRGPIDFESLAISPEEVQRQWEIVLEVPGSEEGAEPTIVAVRRRRWDAFRKILVTPPERAHWPWVFRRWIE